MQVERFQKNMQDVYSQRVDAPRKQLYNRLDIKEMNDEKLAKENRA